MTLLEGLIAVAEDYMAATGARAGSISNAAFNDGKRLQLILDRKVNITTKRYETILRWFSKKWPPGRPWPKGVMRPKAMAE